MKMTLKNQLYFFLSFIAILFFTSIQAISKPFKVVIDAGHGGRDPGAIGFFSNEKDINLAVALRLGQMLNDSAKGKVQVIYTRTSDVFLTLVERHSIANSYNADLFISIHVNSTMPRKEVIKTGTKRVKTGKKKYKTVPVYKTIYHKETFTSGTETYVLGLHRMDQKEDAISNTQEIIGESTGILDMSDPATSIIISQYSQKFLAKSVTFANKIQGNFKTFGRRDLGVKQKGLEVLAGSAMPGVLIELGFINNKEEERYLNSDQGVYECAYVIYKAIMDYANLNS